MRLFGSRKPAPEPEPEPEPASAEIGDDQGDRRFDKEIEVYPATVRLLWHFYQVSDQGKEEGAPREFPGPIDEPTEDGVHELEKQGLIEVIPSFGDFGVTAKMTKLGLQLMATQSEPGRIRSVRIVDPATASGMVFKEVSMGD